MRSNLDRGFPRSRSISFEESVTTFFSLFSSLLLSLAEEVAVAADDDGPLQVVDVTPNCEILEAEANSVAVAAKSNNQFSVYLVFVHNYN